jgi:hypothetical protein
LTDKAVHFRSSGEARNALSSQERQRRFSNRARLRVLRASTLVVKHSNGNIDWNATFEKYILPAIRNQPAPRSIRGNLYHLLSKNVLMKNDYAGLDDILTSARKAGLIPWDAVINFLRTDGKS